MKKYKKPILEVVITGLDDVMSLDEYNKSSDKDPLSKRTDSTWDEPEEDTDDFGW